MITRTLLSATHDPASGGPGGSWCVLFDHEVHGTYAYVFPVCTLWYRSAEYGIDLADADTLLDVVLHEMAMVSIGRGLTQNEPDFVFHVEEGMARTGHLMRTDRAKDLFEHPDPDGLLQKIRDHHLGTLHDPELRGLHLKSRQTAHSIRRQRGVPTKEPTSG